MITVECTTDSETRLTVERLLDKVARETMLARTEPGESSPVFFMPTLDHVRDFALDLVVAPQSVRAIVTAGKSSALKLSHYRTLTSDDFVGVELYAVRTDPRVWLVFVFLCNPDPTRAPLELYAWKSGTGNRLNWHAGETEEENSVWGFDWTQVGSKYPPQLRRPALKVVIPEPETFAGGAA